MKILLFVITLTLFTACTSGSNPNITPNQTEINGYTVPVMPDSTINNSTLNGVDSDSNGIRDDIDRHIAETYPDPIIHSIAELRAKTFLDKFKDPENAYEKKLYVSSDKFIDCESYIEHSYNKSVLKNFKFQDLDNKIINTDDRAKAKWKYNSSLSGHAFMGAFSATSSDCPSEINDILKNYKKIQ